MTLSPFFVQDNAYDKIMRAQLDLDLAANFYAILLLGGHQPAAANTTYANLAQISSHSITGATQANPVVITSVGHGLTTGDHVAITGVVGMTELNGNTYHITTLSADTYSLQTVAVNGANSYTNTDVDGTGFTAYTSGGTGYETLEISAQTGYVRQALTNNTVITDGKRRSFDCDNISFGTTVTLAAKYLYIIEGTAAAPAASDLILGWTDLNENGGDITDITVANPGVVTSAGHGLANSDVISIMQSDMVDVNRTIHTIAGVAANTYQIGNTLTYPLSGRSGRWTQLNSNTEAYSSSSDFGMTIPTNGLTAVG